MFFFLSRVFYMLQAEHVFEVFNIVDRAKKHKMKQ